jgi:hypothetical protein
MGIENTPTKPAAKPKAKTSKRKTSPKGKTTMREALLIAMANGKPAKTKAITDKALQVPGLAMGGKTPAATMGALLAVDNKTGKPGLFTRTAPGTYKLTAKGKQAAKALTDQPGQGAASEKVAAAEVETVEAAADLLDGNIEAQA